MATASQMWIATAFAVEMPLKMPSASVVVTVQRTKTRMASAMMSTTAWVRSTLAAYATALARFTSADVLTSLKATATATATKLDALGVCGGDCAEDADADGICDDVDECVGELDACGVCNGPGEIYECGCSDIPEGDCDCDGNQLDALGVCGGDCTADEDADGICDDVDDCVGALDACGVCNGPGEIYECGCADIPEGDCDCDGNQLDALGNCGGDCAEDADADGICDDVDDCVGELDACGVCNGPGEIYECGCADIPEGDCDCDGNQLDALGVCGGDCTEDADADGICDDVDDCVGESTLAASATAQARSTSADVL